MLGMTDDMIWWYQSGVWVGTGGKDWGHKDDLAKIIFMAPVIGDHAMVMTMAMTMTMTMMIRWWHDDTSLESGSALVVSKGGSVSRRGQTEPPLDGSLQHNYQDDELVMNWWWCLWWWASDDGADDDGGNGDDVLKDSVKSNDEGKPSLHSTARCSTICYQVDDELVIS